MDEFTQGILSPLQILWATVAGFVPKLISVLLILVVGWIIASVLQKAVIRFLKLARLDTVSEKSGIANVLLKGDISQTLSEIIGSLVYWLLMLIVILAAVDALNWIKAGDLLNQVILYIPKVIAALLILVLGIFFASVLATTVRTTAANAGINQAKGLGRVTQVVVIMFTVIQALFQLGIDVTVLNLIVQAAVYSIALGIAIALGLGCKDIVSDYVRKLIESFRK